MREGPHNRLVSGLTRFPAAEQCLRRTVSRAQQSGRARAGPLDPKSERPVPLFAKYQRTPVPRKQRSISIKPGGVCSRVPQYGTRHVIIAYQRPLRACDRRAVPTHSVHVFDCKRLISRIVSHGSRRTGPMLIAALSHRLCQSGFPCPNRPANRRRRRIKSGTHNRGLGATAFAAIVAWSTRPQITGPNPIGHGDVWAIRGSRSPVSRAAMPRSVSPEQAVSPR